jgi:hypothetical protein
MDLEDFIETLNIAKNANVLLYTRIHFMDLYTIAHEVMSKTL